MKILPLEIKRKMPSALTKLETKEKHLNRDAKMVRIQDGKAFSDEQCVKNLKAKAVERERHLFTLRRLKC